MPSRTGDQEPDRRAAGGRARHVQRAAVQLPGRDAGQRDVGTIVRQPRPDRAAPVSRRWSWSLLALIGLFLRPPPRVALVYLVALALAFDMSLGLSGYSYRLLYRARAALSGPARAGAARDLRGVLPCGARGVRLCGDRRVVAARRAAGAGDRAGRRRCSLEYRVRPLELVPYPNAAPPLVCLAGAAAARGRRGAADDARRGCPASDPAYSYLSTFHWQPIVNGYSGFYPATYLSRLDDTADFPRRTVAAPPAAGWCPLPRGAPRRLSAGTSRPGAAYAARRVRPGGTDPAARRGRRSGVYFRSGRPADESRDPKEPGVASRLRSGLARSVS